MGSSIIETANHLLLRHKDKVALGIYGITFTLFAAYLFSLSIQYADTDLWYHLTGGRYFVEQGGLYNPLVYSYIDTTRDHTNYFWGFQLLVYGVWSIGGELGLVLLKGGLLLTSAYFASRVILGRGTIADATFLKLLVIGIIVGILAARGVSLRPHLASYIMIPLFIYLLAYRVRLYPLLPVLTIIWVNLHGVEYVVGALICGSYFLAHLWRYLKDEGARDTRPMIWIALCLPAMFVNPNHVHLLVTPFLHDPDLGLYISELAPAGISAGIDLQQGISINTLVLMLFLIVAASVVITSDKPDEVIAPLLIAAGGLILLIMAKRFIWEWALLSTPLLAAALTARPGPLWRVPATLVMLCFLVMLPLTYWPTMRNGLQHYPFDQESLPYGTTRFIEVNNLTGRYAVEPSYAGYVEFVLAPDISIHMDMQFPPFTSMDTHEINAAQLSPGGLAAYVNKYAPDLIGARKSNPHFPRGAAAALGYAPVFFDKKVVLYIDANKYPAIAEQYALKVVNPFDEATLPGEHIDAGIEELKRMLTVADTNDVKLTLVGLLVAKGNAHQAEVYLSELEQTAPSDLSTIYYRARTDHLADNCDKAVSGYEKAIRYGSQNSSMHRFAAECYFLIGDQNNAYRHFTAALNPYKDNQPDALLYFQYALSAVGAGETEHAIRILNMIDRFAPDSAIKQQIADLLEDLQRKPS